MPTTSNQTKLKKLYVHLISNFMLHVSDDTQSHKASCVVPKFLMFFGSSTLSGDIENDKIFCKRNRERIEINKSDCVVDGRVTVS